MPSNSLCGPPDTLPVFWSTFSAVQPARPGPTSADTPANDPADSPTEVDDLAEANDPADPADPANLADLTGPLLPGDKSYLA